MKRLLSTKEVADFLGVNEKMVYTLVSEKGLPASKITGKWLFPRHLVEQWIEMNTVNYPDLKSNLDQYRGVLIIAGSNDLLLDKTISIYNAVFGDNLAVFGNLGSMGGLKALRRNHCHIATSHLLQENETEYNFEFAGKELERMPVIVNFCKREQGLLIKKGNPKGISGIKDLVQPDMTIVNRPLGTGTRLLFDHELKNAGIRGEKLRGYSREVPKHIDAGIEVLCGRADVAPCIRPVAELIGLDFIPLRYERYDLMIPKERFFDQEVQNFLGLLHEKRFREAAEELGGYDVSLSGKMIFPGETEIGSST